MKKLALNVMLVACFSMINLAYADVGYSTPITITQGSTTAYQGNWQSDSISTPAVDIKTTAPVTIKNCHIKGPGLLIKTVPGAHLTLQNCSLYGLNPEKANLSRPRVLDGIFSYLVVENNLFDHTAGMSVWNMVEGKGNSVPTPSSAIIRIRYNKVQNIDGRLENGGDSGSYLPTAAGQPKKFDDHKHVNFVSIVGFLSDPNIEIAWNQIINQPNQSASEDLILIMSSSGVSAKQPILIHDNYIQGLYGAAPSSNFHYGGTGINSGDYLGRLKDPQYVSAFVHTYNNQIVGPLGWGLGIPAGHNITIENNRVIRSGFLPDGTPMVYTATGLMMVDLYKLEPKSSTPVFYNNKIINNTIGYMSQNPKTQNRHFDYEFYGAPGKPNVQCIGKSRQDVNKCCIVEKKTARAGNTITCSPNSNYKAGSTISLADEKAEMQIWQQKLAKNNITLGPSN